MTKLLHRLSRAAQGNLLSGPWPPEVRALVDTWVALYRWHEAGEHIYRLREGERTPAIAPDLPLATAALRRLGQCYVLEREDWIIIARQAAGEPVPVKGERVLSFRQPILVYCTGIGDGLASGYFSLTDQPTPRELKLLPGIATAELWTRKMEAEEIGIEGVRLARTLPLFYGDALP